MVSVQDYVQSPVSWLEMGGREDLLGSHWALMVASLWQEEGDSPLNLVGAAEDLEDNLCGVEVGKEEVVVHVDSLSGQEVAVDQVEGLVFQRGDLVDSLLA